MRLLLDTHAWIWWNTGSPRLPRSIGAAIATNGDGVFVSAASIWETVTKYRLGKLPEAEPFVAGLEEAIDADGFVRLAISTVHAYRAASFDHPHKDPFDRLLIAQALVEDMDIVSNERIFDAFGVRRLWE
ncbi:PIN domain nuclease [Kaistia algarum]|uniref:type II toxin-antitoxin system VapC family toxin n=1 Tax=Kaistia algarum TaxID=2083279 RepID=UPI000CE76343|nr:type II toxin-antitoxin system VapC family toxin [Kaistia algarum]MCX5512375.1 type II toxin-antitoxin system VapC family toxin [Kaistia algarum]PPE80456.1 PIN domain nuclease [Kaistia algarum]